MKRKIINCVIRELPSLKFNPTRDRHLHLLHNYTALPTPGHILKGDFNVARFPSTIAEP